MNLRVVAFAGVMALGACAHAQPQIANAPQQEQERWQRIMQRMREDSITAANAATQRRESVQSVANEGDGSFPGGIDISRFQLPIQYNERVQEYIDLYAQRRRGVFASWMRRMGRYRSYIEERLAAHGMPRELVYLALIESGYETNAKSHASAVGLWQFMSGTARAEGLEVSDWVDERRDPFRSTDAAIRHLSGLYNQFGSWYLAAAAYNSGSGRIARLLKEYGRSKGPDETFWEVQDQLPSETRGYVPGLVAAAIIGEYPQLFGFDDVVPDRPVQFDVVLVPQSTDLRAVARAAGATVEEIRMLNPQFIRGATPPARESSVRVPAGAGPGFLTAFAKLPSEVRVAVTSRTHVVRRGETLSEIAERYGTTVDALQRANRIQRPELVSAGRKLTIPSFVSEKAYGTD